MVTKSPRKCKKKCLCDKKAVLEKITGNPPPLPTTEINQIRLNLFTERNSDGTRYLLLRGRDIFEKFGKRIGDKDIRAISLYIRESPERITRLDLSYNNLSDIGFFKLLKKLLVKGRSSIINLNIMNNSLTEASMLNLAKYAKHVKLKYFPTATWSYCLCPTDKYLRINGNKIGTKGGEYFAKFLIDNTSLEFVDIGETDHSLSSVAHINAALRTDNNGNGTLKCIDFSRIISVFNRYPYESKWLAHHMENLLERNNTIVELHLQKNQLDGHDIEYLFRGLKRNNTLLYLDLGYNRIGEYGIEVLSKYLKEGPSLTFLNVSGNDIKDKGARVLSFGMPHSKIRALDVSHNEINDEGILDILNTIRKPYFIRFLNLWGNNIGFESSAVIKRMLDSGALFQHTIDVMVYGVDLNLHAAYYPNPADRNKHFYYCELDYGEAQPIYHIKRNTIPEKRKYKVDCKHRHKLDKTTKHEF